MTQSEFKLSDGGLTQCDAIERLLRKNSGQWVSMLDLHEVSGSMAVHSRIADLNKKLRPNGLRIENRTAPRVNRKRHSEYRLVVLEGSQEAV